MSTRGKNHENFQFPYTIDVGCTSISYNVMCANCKEFKFSSLIIAMSWTIHAQPFQINQIYWGHFNYNKWIPVPVPFCTIFSGKRHRIVTTLTLTIINSMRMIFWYRGYTQIRHMFSSVYKRASLPQSRLLQQTGVGKLATTVLWPSRQRDHKQQQLQQVMSMPPLVPMLELMQT